jgi:hypothetical protein
MWWADTAADILKQRNGADSAWISILTLSTGAPLATIANFTSTGIDDNATSTAITIDASENVGIGVVPETWSLFNALQLGGNASLIYKNATLSDFSIANNVYYNSGWKYINTDQAARMVINNGGNIVFQTAPSGTADAAATLTTAMTIHNTGGVSVGTGTSISAGNILVNDGIYISSSNGDYQIRGNSTGGGSATLYIGNKSIDTTASDARFKDVIGDCTNGLEVVKALTVKDYTWKEGFDSDTTTVMSGLLAQEVELVDPSLVTKPTPKEAVEAVEEVRDADGNITIEAVEAVEGVNASDEGWSVKYQMVVPKLIQAIQELEARVTALEV